MSAKMNDPPPGLEQVDELVLSQRFSEWSGNIIAFAAAVCKHAKPDDKDREGHDAHPCTQCVNTVRHTFECLAWVFFAAVTQADAKQKLAGENIMVDLPAAYRVALRLLDPQYSLAMPGFGPL